MNVYLVGVNALANDIYGVVVAGALNRSLLTDSAVRPEKCTRVDRHRRFPRHVVQEECRPVRQMALTPIKMLLFAASLSRAFYDFEPDFFQQNVSRIVDDEVALIDSTLEIWPTLMEIVYFQKHCRSLPMRHIKNKERLNGRAA